MNDQYIDEFLQEGEEQITTLNNSLLELEANPDDEAAMEEIFRTAHTLKGNFAAMGFETASDLAHAIEDLLDAMRDGEIAVTPGRMDVIFAGVDQIEAALGNIEDHGEPRIDPSDTIEQLRAELDGDGSDPGASDTGATDTVLAGIDPEDVADTAYQLTITIDPGQLKGADAMIVLEAIADAVPILGTAPDRDAIEDGEFDDTFEVIVDASDAEAIEAVVTDAAPVETVAVSAVTERLSAPAESDADATDAEQSESTADAGSQFSVDEIESVRVDVDRLDHLYRLVEQFVTGHVRLERGVKNGDLDSIRENVEELGKTTETLQDTVIDMRLVPFETIVGKFPRLVRDLAREQDKDIEFTISGRDVEIDRSILSELGDPLTHLLRNAVDHGIEPPEEREAAGKPRTGEIELRARRERDEVLIEVVDDGRGLDVDAIRETAIERGVRTPEELDRMPDSELYDLVFHPGFSTTDEVTDVSGRGVGMDVVQQTISSLDGSINVESELGEGTTVTLTLPVTMAIVQVLVLQVGDEEYGIPIKHVEEITTAEDLTRLDGEPVLEYDDEIYRTINLGDRFAVPNAGAGGKVIRVDPDERRVALACDQVRAQQTVVVKPLEGLLSGTPGLSGTAILGDGEIMYLLDINTL